MAVPVEIEHYSTLIRAGLIRAAWMRGYLKGCVANVSPALDKVLCYNVVKRWKTQWNNVRFLPKTPTS